jgi:hypothetical protein
MRCGGGWPRRRRGRRRCVLGVGPGSRSSVGERFVRAALLECRPPPDGPSHGQKMEPTFGHMMDPLTVT